MSAFDDMNSAVDEARLTIRRGDTVARQLAGLLAGRLQVADVPPRVLTELKRELRNWGMRSEEWVRK